MPKKDTQRRIDERIEGAAQAVGGLVTSSQVITGKPNIIGGWVFGPVSLSNSGVVLHSGGWIQVGSDDHTVRLDAVDTTYRMWAGAPIGADAPFSITVDGSLHAENAYIEGEIVAAEGTIGGFEIGADYIRDVADSMGIASTVTGGDDVRFWAGDTFANRATADFRVTEAGALTATNATITGAITANSGSLGTLNVTGTLTVTTGDIESDNFSTGVSGWQITHDGVAEFQDALIRGTLSTVVFEESTISTVKGSLRIEATGLATGVLASAFTVPPTFPPDTGYLTIGLNDPEWADSSFLTVSDGVNSDGVQVLSHAHPLYEVMYTGANSGRVYAAGSLVFESTGTTTGYLMMTADPVLNGPRIVVASMSSYVETIRAVIGNLDGTFGQASEVYGIGIGDYADNNYLLYTPSGFVLKADAVTIGGSISMGDDAWIGYPSGPLITFDNTDEQVEVTGDLYYTGNLKSYKNATTYTGYAFVPLATPATSTSWDGDLYDTDNDEVTIDLSAAFGIPAGVKAVLVNLGGSCATAGKLQYLGPDATYYYALVGRSLVAGVYNSDNGIVPCDANGDIYYRTDAIDGAEFATTIRIWGYWI